MTRTVDINVYCEIDETFATLTELRPDLPKPFDNQLQDWAEHNFTDCDPGTVIENAGTFVYEPEGAIIEIRAN